LGAIAMVGNGRHICPSIVSIGVTGGPSKGSSIGTITENLMNVCRVRVGRATHARAAGVFQYTK